MELNRKLQKEFLEQFVTQYLESSFFNKLDLELYCDGISGTGWLPGWKQIDRLGGFGEVWTWAHGEVLL